MKSLYFFPDVKIAHKRESGFYQICKRGKGNLPAKKTDCSDVTEENTEGIGRSLGVNGDSPAKTLSCLRSWLPGGPQTVICFETQIGIFLPGRPISVTAATVRSCCPRKSRARRQRRRCPWGGRLRSDLRAWTFVFRCCLATQKTIL